MASLDRDLWYLFALNMAVGFSSQLIQPLFPLYLETLNATEVEIGFVIGLASIVATLFMVPSGILINRVGKKRMLVISVFLSMIPTVFIALIKNWLIVTPFFVLFNMAFSFFVPSRMAIIEEKANPTNRGTLFGIMNLAWPIAGIIAPSLSGYLAENIGWEIQFYLSAGIMCISLLPTLLMNVESTDINENNTTNGGFFSMFGKNISFFLVIFFLHMTMTTGQGAVNMVLPIYLKKQIELAPSSIGLFFTTSNAMTLITQIPSGWLADKYGRKKLIIACLLPIPPLLLSWSLSQNWIILLVLYATSYSLWSMTWPATIAILSDNLPRELIGSAIGVRMTGVRFGYTIGPLIGGYMYSSVSHISPFMASAGFYGLSIIISLLLKEKQS